MHGAFIIPIPDIDIYNIKRNEIVNLIKETLENEDTSDIHSIYQLELDGEYFKHEECEFDWRIFNNCLYFEGHTSCILCESYEPEEDSLLHKIKNILQPDFDKEYREFMNQDKKIRLNEKNADKNHELNFKYTYKIFPTASLDDNYMFDEDDNKEEEFRKIINDKKSEKGKLVNKIVENYKLDI